MKLMIQILTVVLLVTSCGKDDSMDDPIVVDPCEGIVCNNGGTCINGQCNCPEQYSGLSCSDPVTPSRVSITKVTVSSFAPLSSDGLGWDTFDSADIYFRVIDTNGNVLYTSSTLYENAEYNNTHTFTLSDLDFDDVTATYYVQILDRDDVSNDDYIFGIEFVPYAFPGAWPPQRSTTPGENQMTLDLSYTF